MTPTSSFGTGGALQFAVTRFRAALEATCFADIRERSKRRMLLTSILVLLSVPLRPTPWRQWPLVVPRPGWRSPASGLEGGGARDCKAAAGK